MFKKITAYMAMGLGCFAAYAMMPAAWNGNTETPRTSASEETTEDQSTTEIAKNDLGEGQDAVKLTVHWGDGQSIDNLVSNVKFDGTITAGDLLAKALKEDPRFYALKNSEGTTVAYGFDTNGDNSAAVIIPAATASDEATTLNIVEGVATAEGDCSKATGATAYDHWCMDSDSKEWKIFANGTEANASTTLNPGDEVILEYTETEATVPSELPYTFDLRPADQMGAWMLPETDVDLTDQTSVKIPMIANIVDTKYLATYSQISAEALNEDGTTVTGVSVSLSDFKNGNVTATVTFINPVDKVMLKPYVNTRYDWDGSGKLQTVKKYGDALTTVNVKYVKVESISIKDYEPGSTIEIDYMGILKFDPVFGNEDATFKTFNIVVDDTEKVTYFPYDRTKEYSLVAHNAGTTNIAIVSKDGNARAEYMVKVAGPTPFEPEEGFREGTFWLNEEWFGHTSGSINYLDPNRELHYRVYGNNNNDAAFGCTSQFATIYADKMIVMSKQAWDGGDTRKNKTGGRCVVVDANTMKRLASFDEIGGDGRSAVGVTPSKAYLGHTKGIRVLDLDNLTLAENDIVCTDGEMTGRNGQMGDMVKAGKYVYAANIGKGLTIIDTETDEYVKTIADTKIQGVAVSADGRVWMADAKKLSVIDQESLEVEKEYTIPGGVTCTSGSWRSQNLYAAKNSNKLYWSNGSGWTVTADLYCWDLDNVEDPSTLKPVYTYSSEDKTAYGGAYATGGIDERTGTYMFCTMPGYGFAALKNWLHFVDLETLEVRHVKMLEYWWFPAMPVFPDKYDPELAGLESISLKTSADSMVLDLNQYLNDRDDRNVHIAVRSARTEDEDIATAVLDGKNLTLTPMAEGKTNLNVELESRGRVVTSTIPVEVSIKSGVNAVEVSRSITLRGSDLVVTGYAGERIELYALSGMEVASFTAGSDVHVEHVAVPAGIYIVGAPDGKLVKIIIR